MITLASILISITAVITTATIVLARRQMKTQDDILRMLGEMRAAQKPATEGEHDRADRQS